MNLDTHRTCHQDNGHVRCDDGRDSGIPGRFQSFPHVLHLGLVDHDVQRKVSLDTVFLAYPDNFL